jgi:hypothetical protein
MMRFLLTFTLFLGSVQAQDPVEILRHSVDLDRKDSEHLKDYTYIQESEERTYRGNKPGKPDSETNEISMLAGRQYERLIAKNGKPLSAKEEKKEQEKMDRELAKRQHESTSDKAKQEKARAEGRQFLNQLADAFILHVEGEEQVSGKPAWVISAEPKPGFRPKESNAKILTKVRGKLWIDQAEYQWVKAEVEILDTISMGFALLRIAPGLRVSFEQTRVNDEVWLPSRISMHGEARVGYLVKEHGDFEITYRDYKRFQTDSKLLLVEEAN